MDVINIGKHVDALVDVHASQRLTAWTAMLEQSLPTKTLLVRAQKLDSRSLFSCKPSSLPKESVEKELNLTYHDSVESLVKICDVVTINCPLHPKTEHLFNKDPLLPRD